MALRNKDATIQIDLPHEPGEFIKVIPPGYTTLNLARDARIRKHILIAKELGQLQRAADPPAPVDPNAPPPEPPDPLAQFDLDTLLETCIVGWSYPEKVTVETIHQLDEVTAEYVGRQLVRKPETETDRKND